MTKTFIISADKKLIPKKTTQNSESSYTSCCNFDLKKIFFYPLSPIPWLVGGPLQNLIKETKLLPFTNLKKELHQIYYHIMISIIMQCEMGNLLMLS